jgi:O-antigen/teichoic acid export membrane protein/polysaccharide pyruvyl transferase WcaK-like protein
MLVSLYTVRIVLNTLGISDYGIYNVVGGIVTLFSFLSGTMASASQRFFAFELGRNDYIRLKQTFSLTFIIYIGIAIVIFLLAETVGLWFLNTQMTIPSERMNAANWVYQFSIFSFIMTVLTIPYNAVIIAREKMKVYAYVSIIDVILKLIIVYLLVLFSFDKLQLYAILTFSVTTIITFIYRTYCKKKFEECTYFFYWDKTKTKEMLSFALWNMIGTIANILRNQGINILLNIFFNPIVNAAQAIAYQINSALTNFTNNFYIATKPQITKLFSSGNIKEMHNLIYRSSKFAFYLMMILSIPLLVKTKYILSLWLANVPEYTVLFVQLVIINSLIEVFSQPLVSGIQANGNMKRYQTTVSIIYLLNLPVSYIILKIGYPPESTIIVSLILILLSFIPRLIICKQIVGISIQEYLIKVFFRVISVFFVVMLFIYWVSKNLPDTLIGLFVIFFLELLVLTIVLLIFGLSASEKKYLFNFIKNLRIIKRIYKILSLKPFPKIVSSSFLKGKLKITHVSAFNYGNAGDTLLPVVLRDLFNNEIGIKKWKSIHVYKEINDKLLSIINKSDALVIGGGGLFLKDTNPNDLSGWQWSCSIEQLQQIEIPIIMFAVGYNRFRGQDEFNPIFKEHLNAFVEKAIFVGIRNNGSIRKLKEYLNNDILKQKLVFQPCMTTLISKIYPNFENFETKDDFIAVNCAFDRENLRSNTGEILKSIARVISKLSSVTKIKYFSHMLSDNKILPFFDELKISYELVQFSSVKQIVHEYSKSRLVIGMRGHAQMIPFGCKTPILSIISHDKMGWFLEDISHPEWGVDVLESDFESKLLDKSIHIYNKYEQCISEISSQQEKLWNITLNNMQIINKTI